MSPKRHNAVGAPVAYLGGKSWLARRISHYIPPHHTYVEVFAGSAKILFAKPRASLEVINDLDAGLINLYRVIADPTKVLDLQRLASLTPFSREEFLHCGKHWRSYSNDVERAWAWFVAARQSRFAPFGTGWNFQVNHSKTRIAENLSRWLSTIELLPDFHQRLRGVHIENRDFRKIIPKLDSPETWFYLDPPYIWSTRRSGKFLHEMTESDHLDLVHLLLNLRGMCLLSGYRHSIYEPLELMGWKREKFKVFCNAAKITKAAGQPAKRTRQPRTEFLWLSPHLQKALGQNAVSP